MYFSRILCTLFCTVILISIIISLFLPQNMSLKNFGWMSEVEISIKLQHCPCSRKIVKKFGTKEIFYNMTTCSYDAFQRGPGQKVVAFSFFGDLKTDIFKKKGYLPGIKGNLDLMAKYYPGWIMRLYFDLDEKDPVINDLCELACGSDILDLCSSGNLPGVPMKDVRNMFGMLHRWFPTLDPQVELFLSRDLDTRFTDREVRSVEEWLSIGAPIHITRDHPWHNIPFIGNQWGANLTENLARENWKSSWEKIFADKLAWAPRTAYGPDQVLLGKHVWPWAQHMSVQHDSYHCEYFRKSIGFPTQRKVGRNNWVGSATNFNLTMDQECPEKCRRKGHPDWIYC